VECGPGQAIQFQELEFVQSGRITLMYLNLELSQIHSSSNVCKMMAVGLGWDRAFGKVDEMGQPDEDLKGWVEVEERGKIVPIWTAFELF